MKANIILFALSSTSFHDTITCCTGLIVMAFGPSFSYCLIRLLYGQKWSDGEASKALQLYCLYIVLLAMNGKVTYYICASAEFFVFHLSLYFNYNYVLDFTITKFNWRLLLSFYCLWDNPTTVTIISMYKIMVVIAHVDRGTCPFAYLEKCNLLLLNLYYNFELKVSIWIILLIILNLPLEMVIDIFQVKLQILVTSHFYFSEFN